MDERTCKNCKYYVALYTKEKTRFKTIMGYCINEENARGNRRRYFTKDDCCRHWEQCKSDGAQLNKSVSEVIFAIQKQLSQILEILENDE